VLSRPLGSHTLDKKENPIHLYSFEESRYAMLGGRVAMLICPCDKAVTDLFRATLARRTPNPNVDSTARPKLIPADQAFEGGIAGTVAQSGFSPSSSVLGNDVEANVNALIANENGRPCDDLSNVALGLVAKGAPHDPLDRAPCPRVSSSAV
jgi:hypothetical protein